MKQPGDAGWGAQYAAAGQYLERQRKERQPPAGPGQVPRSSYSPARPYAMVPRGGAAGYRSPAAPAGSRGWSAGAVVAMVLSGLVLLVLLVALALLVALVAG